jgi:hypothetical protein
MIRGYPRPISGLVALNRGLKSLGYGDLAERIVAVSIECEAKMVESWEAKDGIVGFRKAALARSPFCRIDRTETAQRNADRATRGSRP